MLVSVQCFVLERSFVLVFSQMARWQGGLEELQGPAKRPGVGKFQAARLSP